MIPRAACKAVLPGLVFALTVYSKAMAAYVGDYYFPSTLAITVPTAADFFNPPNFVLLPTTAGVPSTREIDIPATYSKLITPDWAVTFAETFRILEQANGTRTGFETLVLGTQYHLYVNAEHQFIFTVGGTAAIGGTGSSNVAAPSFSTLTPTVFIGKGFGDLPDSMAWLRPVAVTAQVGVALPTRSTTLSTVTLPMGGTSVTETVNPNILQWGFALEYGLITTEYSERTGRFPRGWVPLVEFALETPLNGPLAGQTTGTINPGVIWVGRYFQFGVEAIVPINTASGQDIGVRAQFHLYLPQIFPDTIGRPIFSK